MDHFLKNLRERGKHDSEGRFTLDAARARQKQATFALAKPESYLLKFVQAAVAARASRLAITTRRNELLLSIESEHPNLLQLEPLADALFRLPSAPSALRHLAVGLNAASHACGQEIWWQGPEGTLALGPDESRRFDDTHSSPRLVLRKRASRLPWPRPKLFKSELSQLPAACRYAPLEITVDNRPLERPRLGRVFGYGPDKLNLTRPHLLYELVLPHPQGLRVDCALDFYSSPEQTASNSNLKLWRDPILEEPDLPEAPIPLLLDGWAPAAAALRAEAVIALPLTGISAAMILPVLDGVCLDPIRRREFGFQSLRLVLDVSELNTDLSEFSLLQDDRLTEKLERVRNCLLKATSHVPPHLVRQALQRAGVDNKSLSSLFSSSLERLELGASPTPTLAGLINLTLADTKVYLSPEIPEPQLSNARKIHTRHLPEDETVLALYDNTIFGSAKENVVLTEQRICWSGAFTQSNYLLWSELPHVDPPQRDKARLKVAGTEISGLAGNVDELAWRLEELLGAASQLDLEPLHQHPPGDARVLELALATLGRRERFHYAPYHPTAWLDKLFSIHRRHWPEEERALVIYDDTLGGSAEDGFIVTEKRLMWKNIFLSANSLEWSRLSPDDIHNTPTGIRIQEQKILVHVDALRQPVVDFFRQMARSRS